MKKIAKISLVAAIAVAGFTTANAQPLEEAIKNVDVSGSVVYRYNDYNDNDLGSQANSSSTNNNYKVGLNLSSKVNDDVKFNTRILAGTPSVLAQSTVTSANSVVTNNNSSFATLDSQANSDQNVELQLSTANFAYTGVKNTTVTVGKQGLTTPYTVATQIDDNEQTGTGILALSAVGPVTLGGAYFNETNIDKSGDLAGTLNSLSKTGNAGSLDIAAVAAIAAVGPVTLDAWYLDTQDLFDTYTVGAKSEFKLGEVTVGADARYASLEIDKVNNPNGDKNSIAKLALTAKAGIVSGKLAYAATGKDGGITALDSDAVTALKGWNLNSLNKFDADYWQAVAGVDILSNLNLSANYGNLQSKNAAVATSDIEEEEIYAQLTYKMSKNLSTYVRYGTYTKETTVNATNVTTENNDDTRGRLQVAYTF